MDTPNSPKSTGRSNNAFWAILIVVVIIVVVVGLYFYLYKSDPASNNNTTVNTNTVSNTNSQPNTNGIANVNGLANSNSSTNTNESVDTSDWKTYDNTILGISFRIPQDWTATTIADDSELGQSKGDSLLVSGQCPSPCNIKRDICEIGITGNVMPGVSSISNPTKFIQDLASYKGASIAEHASDGVSFYKTTVAVTPAIDGSEGMGSYTLFGITGGTKYFASALSKGFENPRCVSMYDEITSTIEIR